MRLTKRIVTLTWGPLLAIGWLLAQPAMSAERPTIGGFSLASVASGALLVYNDGDLPIPATPTVEDELAFSTTTLNFGPVSHALASAVWPGSTIAEVGPALGLLLPVNPGVPAYPVRAESRFPTTSGPDHQETEYPSTSMRSKATPQMARAAVGIAAVEGAAGIIRGVFTSAASNSLTPHDGTSQASASASNVEIMGGLVRIASVTSTAKAVSNGKTALLSGSTAVLDASVNGVPVVIDSAGVHAAGQDGDARVLTAQVQTALAAAGVHLFLATPVDIVSGSSGERSVGGLTISFNGTDLANLPGGDTLAGAISLNRTLSFTMGSVLVRAAASAADQLGQVGPLLGLPGAPSDRAPGGDVSGYSVAGAPAESGDAAATDVTGGPNSSAGAAASEAPVAVAGTSGVTAAFEGGFRGVGGGVVLLAMLAWAVGLGLMMRLNRAVGADAETVVSCPATRRAHRALDKGISTWEH